MIIGNGLIAKQFYAWKNTQDILVFASGVSNSKENDSKAFKREFDLIQTFRDTQSCFIYFSTCSVYDPNGKDSLYIKHKIHIERYIQDTFSNYLILRLPNVVGKTDNPNTFFNFFYTSILRGTNIDIQKYSIRYFLDVEIIQPITAILIHRLNMKNKAINIAFNNPITILDMLAMMETIMGKKANVNILEEGSTYSIPNDEFIQIYSKFFEIHTQENHTLKCVKKYLVRG